MVELGFAPGILTVLLCSSRDPAMLVPSPPPLRVFETKKRTCDDDEL